MKMLPPQLALQLYNGQISVRIKWQLFILYHHLAQLEELEKEWQLTDYYRSFSKDNIDTLMSYGALRYGDFHAKEIHYAVMTMDKSDSESKEKTLVKLSKWNNDLMTQMEKTEDEIRDCNKIITSNDLMQKIHDGKKLLINHYIQQLHKERIALDINNYINQPSKLAIKNAEIFFVKRALARYFQDYLPYEEKKIIHELLIDVGILLKKTDDEHLVKKYADPHGFEQKKEWYKQSYYYSIYELRKSSSEESSYAKTYLKYIEKWSVENKNDDSIEADEPLINKKERLRKKENQEREMQIKKLLNDQKNRKESSRIYEDLQDPVGYLKLAKNLEELLVIDPDELSQFDELTENFSINYRNTFKVPDNHRQDAVKKAKKYSKKYLYELINRSKKVDALLNQENMHLFTEDQPLVDLIEFTRHILQQVALQDVANEIEQPLLVKERMQERAVQDVANEIEQPLLVKERMQERALQDVANEIEQPLLVKEGMQESAAQDVANEIEQPLLVKERRKQSNRMLPLSLKIFLASLLIAGLVVSGMVTGGLIPSLGVVVMTSFGAIGVAVNLNIAIAIGISAVSAVIGMVGGLIGMMVDKCTKMKWHKNISQSIIPIEMNIARKPLPHDMITHRDLNSIQYSKPFVYKRGYSLGSFSFLNHRKIDTIVNIEASTNSNRLTF
ncbi:MAG: hypothetical protein A3F11_06300 [Gammaproteobacteria bacterium RIFCSPHIGHO2_12_FULL_37_14]|nr:MAG: hypothetical protein A3F11_06300 [Gammaproteobacteria bacterium RIFCSPHIGHO2_12_FULL_37_14]